MSVSLSRLVCSDLKAIEIMQSLESRNGKTRWNASEVNKDMVEYYIKKGRLNNIT